MLNVQFEKAVRLLVAHFPISDETSRKPVLFHDIRVGVYLYERGYAEDIVLGGLLHDALEWSSMTEDMIRDGFGERVRLLVKANTKDDSIVDKFEKTNELIQRCIESGQDALIIKTADIIDSFTWYSSQNNEDQLRYCMRNARAIDRCKPNDFTDKIFDELKVWEDRFSHLNE